MAYIFSVEQVKRKGSKTSSKSTTHSPSCQLRSVFSREGHKDLGRGSWSSSTSIFWGRNSCHSIWKSNFQMEGASSVKKFKMLLMILLISCLLMFVFFRWRVKALNWSRSLKPLVSILSSGCQLPAPPGSVPSLNVCPSFACGFSFWLMGLTS